MGELRRSGSLYLDVSDTIYSPSARILPATALLNAYGTSNTTAHIFALCAKVHFHTCGYLSTCETSPVFRSAICDCLFLNVSMSTRFRSRVPARRVFRRARRCVFRRALRFARLANDVAHLSVLGSTPRPACPRRKAPLF